MDKQTTNAVIPCSGILFGHIKVGSTDTCYSIVEPHKCCGKWKNPDMKTTYFMIWFRWNVHKKEICGDRKYVNVCLELTVEIRNGLQMAMRCCFWDDGSVL